MLPVQVIMRFGGGGEEELFIVLRMCHATNGDFPSRGANRCVRGGGQEAGRPMWTLRGGRKCVLLVSVFV